MYETFKLCDPLHDRLRQEAEVKTIIPLINLTDMTSMLNSASFQIIGLSCIFP